MEYISGKRHLHILYRLGRKPGKTNHPHHEKMERLSKYVHVNEHLPIRHCAHYRSGNHGCVGENRASSNTDPETPKNPLRPDVSKLLKNLTIQASSMLITDSKFTCRVLTMKEAI
ncbi:hypothetical protein F511_47036 [Dorcoceras hygrometricum]|uniref:Uncharacterized protein n=1 Tax=Dorcoceras hygrometricum TaxID=472368 RepID=A0A2Z6ZZC4_9LAMI|nr:hypothetical protein F511_47036 [Dorcoceras hygrometricum]